jgi:hypothetical protein
MNGRKIALWTTAAITGIAIFGSAGCSVVGIRTSEERARSIVLEDGDFEIREYAPAIIARTRAATAYDKASGQNFRRLGGYIFGRNVERKSVAMTMPVNLTPVATESGPQGWEMTFFMPSEHSFESLPTPKNGEVALERIPAETVATYRYSGSLDEADLERFRPQLVDWLQSQGYEVAGPALLAGYDPPWTIPFLRRNEVQIAVRRATATASAE